jgi:hypothetical protein
MDPVRWTHIVSDLDNQVNSDLAVISGTQCLTITVDQQTLRLHHDDDYLYLGSNLDAG